ncbi:hypothetical protein JCM3770_005634 [Rhodotorula araucariae]
MSTTSISRPGPLGNFAQWTLEGIIGDDKRHMSSKRYPIASIQRHQKRIPGLTLLCSPLEPTVLSTAEREVDAWAKVNGVEVAVGMAIARWVRLDLGLGNEVVRCGWAEKKEAADEKSRRALEGWEEEGTRQKRSARFAKVSGAFLLLPRPLTRFIQVTLPGWGTRLADVHSFFSVPLADHDHPRLLALVTHYEMTSYSGIAETGDLEWGFTEVIGVESFRCVAGLVPRARDWFMSKL